MKKLLLHIFLGFFITSNAHAIVVNAEDLLKNDYGESINNKIYCGYINYDPGSITEMKILSKFFVDKENNLIFGTYLNEEFGELINGIFYNGTLKDKDMKINTTDQFGNGKLILKFNNDFSEFIGTWTDQKSKMILKWDGKTGDFCKE